MITDDFDKAARSDRARRDIYSLLLANVREIVICCDGDGNMGFVSDAARTLLGYDPESIIGRSVVEFIHPDDVTEVVDSIARWQGRVGRPRGAVLRVVASDGTWHRLYYDGVITNVDMGVGSVVITMRPEGLANRETAAVRAMLFNEDRLVRLASAFLHVPYEDFDKGLDTAVNELAGLEWVTRVSVWLVDGERFVLRASWDAPVQAPLVPLPEWIEIGAYRMLQIMTAGEEVRFTIPWVRGSEFEAERRLFDAAGTQSVSAVPMVAAEKVLGAVIVESTVEGASFDATHATTLRSAAAILAEAFVRHGTEDELAYRARTDRVTGLANRWAFDAALEHSLQDLSTQKSAGFGVAVIDIDHFKLVNDSEGHIVGDRLLLDVAARLRHAAPSSALLARLGGNEFLALVTDSPSVSATLATVSRLVEVFASPFDIAGRALILTASTGVVHQSDAHASPSELLRWVDLAVSRGKRSGGDAIELDDPASRVDPSERFGKVADLGQALADHEFEVHYQGEWDLSSGELIGAEALARWNHPTRGLLEAGEFIPLMEATGSIRELGQWVLATACQDAAGWVDQLNGRPFTLRVNVSAQQLRREGLLDQVADALADSGLPPGALCLELTESSLLADPVRTSELLSDLRGLGVGLAIDDFGTGYSSILQLKQLPLSALKVDQSFVSGLPDDANDRAIVRATLELADAFGIEATAEGVENDAQRRSLLRLGCRRAQGFLLARPESAALFRERVALQCIDS